MDHKLRYLVTGGAGFIGSHLVELLLGQGHAVTVVDNLSTGKLDNLAAVLEHPSLSFVEANLENEQEFDAIAPGHDVIVHLAAVVGVRLVADEPARSLESNLRTTDVAVRAAVKHGCGLVFASSSEVYGNSSQTPHVEDADLVIGSTSSLRWSYAAAKIAGEFQAQAYHQAVGLNCVIVRFFNTIGPRQSDRYGMVAPNFVRQALAGKRLTVYGGGEQTRCFCDVRDVVRAVSALSRCAEANGQVFNIGSMREMSIRSLAEQVIAATGSSSDIEYIPFNEVYYEGFEDIARRVPDTGKVGSMIAWRPEIELEQTLEEIIEAERSAKTESAAVRRTTAV